VIPTIALPSRAIRDQGSYTLCTSPMGWFGMRNPSHATPAWVVALEVAEAAASVVGGMLAGG
jgi:hypothetical protein